jgi:hypothetical protein
MSCDELREGRYSSKKIKKWEEEVSKGVCRARIEKWPKWDRYDSGVMSQKSMMMKVKLEEA